LFIILASCYSTASRLVVALRPPLTRIYGCGVRPPENRAGPSFSGLTTGPIDAVDAGHVASSRSKSADQPGVLIMLRMPRWRLFYLLVFLASIASNPGCSDDSAGAIDTKAAIEKASGGDGTARQSAKARAASEEAAKTHPKLH
jgi:hypothetical protein